MTAQEVTTSDASWGQAKQPASRSLGPANPAWLAKLSAHLGIHPTRTIAPLLLSVWPGTSVKAVCCREACAYLMQVCMVFG
jgi:hypothetical protein